MRSVIAIVVATSLCAGCFTTIGGAVGRRYPKTDADSPNETYVVEGAAAGLAVDAVLAVLALALAQKVELDTGLGYTH